MYTLNKFYFKPKKYHKNSGFSLMEMVITTIMVGVIAAVTVPNIIGLFNRNQVNESLADVEGAIREAQRLAIKRKGQCTVQFDTDSTTNITTITGTPSGCLLNQRELGNNITINTNISGTPTSISFSGKGNTGSSGTLVVSSDVTDTKKCVLVTSGLGIVKTGDYDENDLSSISDDKCETN